MAKITKAQASDQEIIVVRNANTNKIERVVIPSDVVMGIVGYNLADLTVLGSLKVSGGISGALKLPDGTNTIQPGSNVTITYNQNGTVTITSSGGSLADGDKGDVTVSQSGNIWTIDSAVVTNAKLANMTTGTIKGRVTNSTGSPQDLSSAQATSLLDTFTSNAKGLVPAPGNPTGRFLKDDGTWVSNGTSSLVKLSMAEAPTGQIDGTNKVFTLANSPNPSSSTQLFYNGQMLVQGNGKDYTLNGAIITLSNTFTAPVAGDILLATYAWDANNTTVYNYEINEDLTFTLNNANPPKYTATLAHSPNPTGSLMLFMNGYLLVQGNGKDYTLSTATITLNFDGGVVGSTFTATYQY